MGKKYNEKKNKKTIPKKAVTEEVKNYVRANNKEIKIMGLVSKEINDHANIYSMHPYVALKYFKSDWQCFSDWESHELKAFSSFLETLSNHTWKQVYQTGSRVPKHGLAYTKYEIKDVRSEAIRKRLESVEKKISEDMNFFELRVDQNKLRVHGFQSQSAFFLVALDRNHEAFPM
ncbi:MAG: hypothetical protein DRI57_16085 [Deltaproteobacteria bacterium]|nr:MAG: hypothetical protein DRI57_16085 [Deltaproteobacteria bacterium]